MDYIYGAVFSDNTVKFGRSVDVWKRLYSHDSDGKRFGRSLTSCFISTVFDSVRCERSILQTASDMLVAVSRESFHIKSISDVGEVFQASRIPFIFCEMGAEKFGPVIGQNSFSTDFDLVSNGGGFAKKATKKNRVEARILNVVGTYNGAVTGAILKNKLQNYPFDYVMEALDGMVDRGEIIKVENPASKCGFMYKKP